MFSRVSHRKALSCYAFSLHTSTWLQLCLWVSHHSTTAALMHSQQANVGAQAHPILKAKLPGCKIVCPDSRSDDACSVQAYSGGSKERVIHCTQHRIRMASYSLRYAPLFTSPQRVLLFVMLGSILIKSCSKSGGGKRGRETGCCCHADAVLSLQSNVCSPFYLPQVSSQYCSMQCCACLKLWQHVVPHLAWCPILLINGLCTPVTSCATLITFCFLCSEYKMMLKVCCRMAC